MTLLQALHITTSNLNKTQNSSCHTLNFEPMEDFKKKRILRTIIIVLIGAFILWQVSLLYLSRNRIKEDGKEIMEFLKESEERTQQNY